MHGAFSNRRIVSVMIIGLFLLRPDGLRAQGNGVPVADNVTSLGSSDLAGDYTIGANDLLIVTITDTPEFGGKFRVSDSGFIEIQGASRPVAAAGKTPPQVAREIRNALIESKQLRNPQVTVFVEEYHSRAVTVLGSVTKPGVYPLEKHTTVLDALSLAGGALPNAGNTVTVVRGPASAEAFGTTPGSVQIIDVSRILSGRDPSANVEVRTGDVINVSVAQVVYVVGAVTKPGGFPMSDPSSGVSIIQAVALAEGLSPMAATHRGVIIRQSTSGVARQEIPVDVSQMMSGKQTDLVLAPNDILYIPESSTKKAAKVLGDVAMAAINGIAIYGIGYRVGNIP